MNCRNCNAELSLKLIDLGSSPPSNAYLNGQTLHCSERWFPLKVLVCESCWLAQTEEYSSAEELFNDEYAYFSSFSDSWLAHAEHYVTTMVERFGLTHKSHVIEVASNDGYLLQYIKQRGIACMGIEPTAGTAAAARIKRIETLEEFFGVSLANKLKDQGKQADLMIANNVLAHVPNINDFSAGFSVLLKPQGAATFEFPHLMQLIEQNQFDTIYHEHFSYLSFTTVVWIFSANGLSVFDVEELDTHGGSLRVFAQRKDTGMHPIRKKVQELINREIAAGMNRAEYYIGFQDHANRVKNDFLFFLLDAKRRGKSVAAYGAAAKGNTLMNYAGIRPDLVSYVVDRNPAKQGKSMPGSRIPIVNEEHLYKQKPDYVVILPWNLRAEVMQQLKYIIDWGGRFVTAVPHLEITP
ncbi:MAG: SAM-dependent methyltransferase [Candidatus Margulisbacteria bacterium GWF2_35_9]|nr:MAG: SAM-dependent methyltransferase [Candidatus Margulisbacteria bacterium GWF2_35_9]